MNSVRTLIANNALKKLQLSLGARFALALLSWIYPFSPDASYLPSSQCRLSSDHFDSCAFTSSVGPQKS